MGAVILGSLLGFGIAFLVVSSMVDKSNNIGDSKGDFHTFSKHPVTYRFMKDRVNSKEEALFYGSPTQKGNSK